MSILQARRLGLHNYSVLVSQACVPAAMRAILEAPTNRVQAFLAAGHVCAVMGTQEYHDIAHHYGVPIVVTGFEPVDLVHGVRTALRQLHEGRAEVENAYSRVVVESGNRAARDMVDQVFERGARGWRGIGALADSGLHLRPAFADFDAARRFDVGALQPQEPAVCIAGEILQGLKKPWQCPAFGSTCSPETPLGATMVSDEGACAAYYRYGRHTSSTPSRTTRASSTERSSTSRDIAAGGE
jgi:hydrogenase expression/formation protein HypD